MPPNLIRENLRKTILLSVSVTVCLILTLWVVDVFGQWPEPESRPHQGEAVDRSTLQDAHPAHSREALARLIREPQDTWSNLAFVVAGAALISGSRLFLTRNVGLALIATGVGSFLYHASASYALRSWDIAAMYWLFLAAIPLALVATFPSWAPLLERRGVAWCLGLATPLVGIALMSFRGLRIFEVKVLSIALVTTVFALLMIFALTVICFRERNATTFLKTSASIGLFLLAVLFRRLDEPGGLLYDPALPIQGHALWHLLSAGAFYGLARALDSQGSKPSPQGRRT